MGAGAADYSGYQRLPSWVLGFHGCDESVGRRVLTSPTRHLKPSRNPWDWLGSGIYFWENDPQRALQFALEGMEGKVTKGRIKRPFVIGAVIDLGLCCNLFDQAALTELQAAFGEWRKLFRRYGLKMPKNKGKGRFRDREVFEHMHTIREKVDELPPYQTVRGGFPEGRSLYPGAGFTEQHHIQIAVRDVRCIRGYFLPRLDGVFPPGIRT